MELSAKTLAFEQAFAAMKAASKSLDCEVEQRMAGCSTIGDLMALADSLPKDYRNIRRVYEQAARIDESTDN